MNYWCKCFFNSPKFTDQKAEEICSEGGFYENNFKARWSQ